MAKAQSSEQLAVTARLPNGRQLIPMLPPRADFLRFDFDLAVLLLMASSVAMGICIGLNAAWAWKIVTCLTQLGIVYWAGRKLRTVLRAAEMWSFAQGRGLEAQLQDLSNQTHVEDSSQH